MENCPSQAQSSLRSSAQQRATNENHITVNLPPQQLTQACQGELKAITLQPQPIQLAVDTSTDWPSIAATSSVGLTGAMVAFAVGYMAYLGQRNQVRAARANFRHGWQQEIKQLIGKFISASARIHYEIIGNPDYLNSSESNQLFSDLMETHARIELMLDRSKPYYEDISRITASLIKSVKEGKVDNMNSLANELIDVSNGVIEKAWQDIRNDLKGKKKKAKKAKQI